MNSFNWGMVLLQLPGILIGLTIHEFAHAFLAVKLGDDTPLHQKRYTLNPIRHLDFVGLIMIIIAGIGWAKPVQTNPNNYKNPRRDEILVSLIGPLANFGCSILFIILLKILDNASNWSLSFQFVGAIMLLVLYYAALTNLALSIFNLLPIPPLDGSHVLLSLIPDQYYKFKYNLMQYGSFILIAIILIGNFSGKNILPIYNWAESFLKSILKLLGY